MQGKEILRQLYAQRNPQNVAGMARLGINPRNTLGVSIPTLRRIARQAGKDHRLAQELWKSGIHEARILAALVDVPEQVTEAQMERWVKDFDSWDVCDQVCSNLFDKTRFARRKAIEWSKRDEEFVKRAGFVMMAALAVHDKSAPDVVFRKFLRLVQRGATDDRNFVKKAVNWALRQIGKRNAALNRAAQATAREIQQIDSRAARWIAADALRELKLKASWGR
jgi:3-methyladenine DNA glycosylase AlkD